MRRIALRHAFGVSALSLFIPAAGAAQGRGDVVLATTTSVRVCWEADKGGEAVLRYGEGTVRKLG